MKKVFYTFALLVASLMSCESNSDGETSPPDTSNNDSILPTKVDIVYSDGETETIQYTYNGMTLTKEESSDGHYTDYIYEDNKLTKINYYDAPNLEILESYTYDAQGRVATISTNIVGVGVYRYSLSYNADNSVITTSFTGNGNNEPSIHTINNGNIVIFNEAGAFTSTYTYDNKNTPFKNIDNRDILLTIDSENNDAIDFNLNNLLTEDTLENATSNSNNYLYTYTYTAFDFPRIVTENDEGDITAYTYSYNND